MSAPQKRAPLHIAIVNDKLIEYRKGPSWEKWMDRIDPNDVADDLARDGKFQTVGGKVILSDSALYDWIYLNQDRYQP